MFSKNNKNLFFILSSIFLAGFFVLLLSMPVSVNAFENKEKSLLDSIPTYGNSKMGVGEVIIMFASDATGSLSNSLKSTFLNSKNSFSAKSFKNSFSALTKSINQDNIELKESLSRNSRNVNKNANILAASLFQPMQDFLNYIKNKLSK